MENGAPDYSKYLIPLAIIGGGLFLYNKFFGSGTGTGSNNAATQTTTQQGIDSSLQQATAQGIPQTITDAQAAAIANAVYSIGTSNGSPLSSDEQSQIVWQVIQCNTITDLLKVMSYFKTRAVSTGWLSLCALVNISCTDVDLNSFIQATLNLQYRSQLNGYLSDQNINYQF